MRDPKGDHGVLFLLRTRAKSARDLAAAAAADMRNSERKYLAAVEEAEEFEAAIAVLTKDGK